MKVTLTPKLFPATFPAGTVAGLLIYAIASAALADDGTPVFTAQQESDGVSPVVFSNVPDGDYTLTETRLNSIGMPLGDPFVQSFSVVSPQPDVTIELPSGALVVVSADDPPTP